MDKTIFPAWEREFPQKKSSLNARLQKWRDWEWRSHPL